MVFEGSFEEGGDLRAIFDRADKGIHAIARSQVMEGDDFPAVVIGGVSGPGQVGPEPMDAFHGLNFVMSDLPGEGLHLTTRDALGELAMQIGGAVGAGSAVRHSPLGTLGPKGLALQGPGGVIRLLVSGDCYEIEFSFFAVVRLFARCR